MTDGAPRSACGAGSMSDAATPQRDRDTITTRLAGVNADTARELGWTEARDDPALNPRLWTEPFLLMSAPDDERCTVAGCRAQSPTRWQVEVVGYQGHGEAPDQGPTFTACLTHLTQQMNRFLPNGGRR